MERNNNLNSDDSWEIHETQFIPEQVVTTGSNYMIGNGYLGYRGTFADDGRDQYVACVVSDTYDNADGVWKELVTVPNGLFTEVAVDGTPVRWREAGWSHYRRALNFRYGGWSADATWKEHGLHIREERFAGYDDLHRISSRTHITAQRALKLSLRTGIDGDIWSLNGEHFSSTTVAEDGEELEIACVTGEHGYDVVVREVSRMAFADGMNVASRRTESNNDRIVRTFDLELEAEQTIVLTKYAAVYSTNDLRSTANPFTQVTLPENPPAPGYRGISPGERSQTTSATEDRKRPTRSQVQEAASSTLSNALGLGWEALSQAHCAEWDRRWSDMDVAITGDEWAQTALRYNLYHNIIATPAHTDHLPIGARGLSCQSYQGAAFWDQEIFNLPMFLFSAPEIARKILMYRYRTLNGARKKARELGFAGAYYAWISGDSGEEICPSFFFKDVISGRPIRTHFNDWQIHVSPDISYTIWKYISVTHDYEYLRRYGAEIVFEVARFLASRASYRHDLDRYEILRVLGPDEYHENVDNNFFTNFQARFTTQYAQEVHSWMREHAPEDLRSLETRIDLSADEVARWQHVADHLYLPEPEPTSGIIPQFDGFFRLEDTTPETLKSRLIDSGEYWGWPNGVAVHTQVSKQADVTQVFMLHPTAYDRDVMRANWEYYEPRTQHGSSLSPAVYAIVAAWVGHMDEAQRYFMKSCTVDLYHDNKAVSGGTFIGGIHTAACGVSWQIVVIGFAGLYLIDGGFGFGPHLPQDWDSLSFSLQRWGARLRVTISRTPSAPDAAGGDLVVTVANSEDSPRALTVEVGGTAVEVAPGHQEAVPYRT
ncbi:MAG TPA: glycosyl hydrolase family 65 protein [Alkalispirochaeta sp.]|nr:glycosyl hydrolase family 65 protein [Alkalispirochaeta sp.]